MKKLAIILAAIILLLSIKKSTLVIPKESIRFRIIANSNEEIDQELKRKIVRSISNELVVNKKDIHEARTYLKNNIPVLENKISKEIDNKDFSINYGMNYFPEKEYKGVKYPEGEYESLVVKLGEGKGENFWCILFPPLCLIEEDNNTEYVSLIKEVLNTYK